MQVSTEAMRRAVRRIVWVATVNAVKLVGSPLTWFVSVNVGSEGDGHYVRDL